MWQLAEQTCNLDTVNQFFILTVTTMTDIATNIEERRFAMIELESIIKLLKTQYGENLPMEIRVEVAELAQMYRKKYGTSER